MGEATTDFSQYSHAQLKAMVDSLNSGDVMKAADPWRRAYDTLKGIRGALQSYSGQATADWEGQASDAFSARMTSLANSVNNAAEYANNTAVTLEIVSDSIDEAKAAMPDEPSVWASGTDWVDDKVSGLLGSDDADTRASEAASRKQQAVAVLQTLASRYLNSADVLKPPPRDSGKDDDEGDYPPPPDGPTGAAAIGGAIIGAGLGGAYGASGGARGTTSTRSDQAGLVQGSAPTGGPATALVGDSAIHGGAAAAPPPGIGAAVAGAGSGTGLDGTSAGISGGTRTPVTAATSLTGGGGPTAQGIGGGMPAPGPAPAGGVRPGTGLAPSAGRGSLPQGGAGSSTAGRSATGGRAGTAGLEETAGGRTAGGRGAARPSGGYGAGAVGEGSGAGGRVGAGRGTGLAGRSGGVVGESLGGARGGAFTEGGTGIGSRSRLGRVGDAAAGQPGGGLVGGARGRRRDKERRGDRPDYLVEDEETWADGTAPHPGVVE
jgi:hypothetical protein